MSKTLIAGLALAVVAIVALVYDGLTSTSTRVDAQSPRAAGNRAAAVALLDVGDLQATFSEVTGIGSESEIEEFREGGDPQNKVRKIPGRLKWQDITLKRGLTGNMDIWDWRKVIEDGGEGFRKDGSLTLLNERRQPIARWEFTNAWPSKVSGPTLNARGTDIALEELVLTHEGLHRAE